MRIRLRRQQTSLDKNTLRLEESLRIHETKDKWHLQWVEKCRFIIRLTAFTIPSIATIMSMLQLNDSC